MKRTSKAIPATFLMAIMIAVSSLAFAQGGDITGSAKDLMAIRTTDGGSSISVGTSTDQLGNYSGDIPSLKNYTLLAFKPGYDIVSASNVSELSYPDLNRSANIFMSQNTELNYKPNAPRSVLSWETGAGKSYLIPALEIPGFILALNGFDRLAFADETEGGKKVYSTNLSTFWDHVVHGHWGFDQDAFSVNQFLHPYAGTLYHGFARSAGLNFWESLGYTFVGSFLWETAGETTHPSINDQIASGIAGSLLGEPLFRMANLLLEGGGGEPGFWRELGAAVISPPTGFNRLVFGDRFKAVFPSRDPAIFHSLWFGAGLLTHVGGGDSSGSPGLHQITSDYTMSYGLPGKPGYN